MLTHRLQKLKMIFTVRFYCKSDRLVPKTSIEEFEKEKPKSSGIQEYKPEVPRLSFATVQVQHWNEIFQIRKQRRLQSGLRKIKNLPDMINYFQSMQSFPSTLNDVFYYFKKRHIRKQLIEQAYLPQRVAVLKPDLAAAHFIIRRGGSVKFFGKHDWVGARHKRVLLPCTYVPGMYIESINAENTELYCEGLQNLAQLKYLRFLSLKNLKTVNDWFLDWVSKEYFLSLKHLDLSGCKNVTYRGLSCFYRFECLETLEVEGVSDTVEFKLACLMLQEIKPNLEIKGIDLSIPKKIDPVNSKETNYIQQS